MEPEQQEYRNHQNGKKPKQKKIPQRGLGVAQLEKMRLLEQQQQKIKKDDPSSQSDHFLLIPPLPPQTSSDYSQTAILKSSLSPPLPVQSYTIDGGYGLLSSAPFRSSPPNGLNFNHICPSHVMLQKQQKTPQLCSSMMNISSPSSSGINNLQMEPPSNQSCFSDYYFPPWHQEEKVVGMKRPWPFPKREPPRSSFPAPLQIKDEPTFALDRFKFEPTNPIFSEVQFDLIGSSGRNPNKKFKENGAMLVEPSLTLGPTTPPNSQSKQLQTTLPAVLYHEFPEFDFHRSQGLMEGAFPRPGSFYEQHRPFYHFLPPGPIRPEAASDGRREGAMNGDDLSLKL